MERLTERTADGILVKENHGENGLRTFYQYFEEKPNDKYTNCDGGYCAIEKLAAYEDAEEQRLLIRLPCKVGDTVYVPTRNFVSELRIILISIERDNVFFYWILNTGIYPNLNGFTASDIGKMVFFTYEEAEAKLAEMEGAK